MNIHLEKFHIKDFLIPILLLICIARIFSGIWDNACLPFGDECGSIYNAYDLLSGKIFSIESYVWYYAAIIKFISADPVTAHFLVRIINSAVAVFALFFFLNKLLGREKILMNAVVALIFATSVVNATVTQYGNINLFTFNLAFVPMVFLIYEFSYFRYLIFILATLLAVSSRAEYGILFYMSIAYMAGILISERKPLKYYLDVFKSVKCCLLLVILIACFLIIKIYSKENLDSHLLIAFGQQYAYFYKLLNPGIAISTANEYLTLINEVFGNPQGFYELARNNPLELIKYIAMNASINSLLLFPSILAHKPYLLSFKLEITILIILCLSGLLVFISRRYEKIKVILHMECKRDLFKYVKMLFKAENAKYVLPVLFTLPAYVSILILYPDPRYWLPLIPLIFLFISWTFQNLTGVLIKKQNIESILLLVLIIIISRPVFGDIKSNAALVDRVREDSSINKRQQPVVAGNTAIGTYAFKTNYRAVPVNEIEPDMIINNYIDYFIFDNLIVDSIFWTKNSEFFRKLMTYPEKYGYRVLYLYEEGEGFTVIYSKFNVKWVSTQNKKEPIKKSLGGHPPAIDFKDR